MKYRSSPIKNILFGVAILGGILFFMIKKGFLSIDLNHERENPHITVQAPTTSEELPIIEKLNAYTFGVNRMAFRTRESYERYRSWVDMETGPTGKERHIYGLYKLYNLQPVLDRYNQAKAKAPRLPELERAGTAYVQALHSLALLAQEAMDYYDQKDYLDDEMALGKAIHSGLKENFDVYFEAEKKLRTRLVHYHTEQKNELLEQAENQGNPMLAQAIKSVDASSELLTIVNEEELFSIDVERLSVEIEKVKTEWKALQGLMDGQTLGYCGRSSKRLPQVREGAYAPCAGPASLLPKREGSPSRKWCLDGRRL